MYESLYYYEFLGLKICSDQPQTASTTVSANESYQGYDDLLDSSASRQLMSTLRRANRARRTAWTIKQSIPGQVTVEHRIDIGGFL